MRIKMSPVFLVLLLLFGTAFSIRSQTPAEENERAAELEKALLECPIESTRKGEPGRTSPWIVSFAENCAIRNALFRYVDRRRPQPMADSFIYDLAAYELTKLLGVDFIPPVVERDVDGRPGTLQVFLENCISEKDRKRKKLEPPEAKSFDNALEEIKVFAQLAYDDCYNTDDLYIHMEDWRVCRVDFSEAFAPLEELLPGCRFTGCSKRLYAGLLGLNEKGVHKALGAFLSDEEIGALLVRKELILERINSLIAENGEANVLF
jgi:hypothetical protein